MKHARKLRALAREQYRHDNSEDLTGEGYDLMDAAAHIDALAARLAEVAAIAHDGGLHTADQWEAMVAIRRLTLPHWNKAGSEVERKVRVAIAFGAADSASAVQPERCCLDYPRCDCNSPPEPDNAPTLQPCGHPWEAQHDFKCILCSSPG